MTEWRRALVTAAALVAISPPSWAKPEHELGLRLALGSASFRDDLLVPLAFSGVGPRLGVNYGFTLVRHGLDADLNFGAAIAENRFDQRAWELYHDFGVGYAYAMVPATSRQWWLGARVRTQTNLAYLETWDDAHGYWLASWALAPTLTHYGKLWHRVWFEGRLEIAAIGFASRPPVYRWNKQDALTEPEFHFDRSFDSPDFFTPLDVQQARTTALIRFRGTERRGEGFGAGLEANFTRAKDPEPFASLFVGLVLAYGWGF